jgi:GH18 family chitinase
MQTPRFFFESQDIFFTVYLYTACIADRVVCYYGSWAVYRPGNGKFDVENIDPTLCTHLIYTFVGINTEGAVTILDSWNEIDKGKLHLLHVFVVVWMLFIYLKAV